MTIKEEASTSDQLLRKVERMLERVTLDKPEPRIRNPNFRGPQQPQYRIKQRETRTQESAVQQQVKTPLQQNFVSQESEDEGDIVGEENHFFTPDDLPTYVTEEEEFVRNSIIHQDDNYILSNDPALEEESEEYQRGYLNALSAQQK